MPLRFSKILPLACCVLLLAAAPQAFAGAEAEFLEFNFAVTPPDGWKDVTRNVSKPQLCVAYAAPDKTGMFLVLRSDNSPLPGELDDRFVTEFEQNSERSGSGKRLSGKFVFVQGIKTYERTGEPVVEGKKMSMLSRTVPIQGHFYEIQGFRWDGRTAGDDPEIRAAFESFRFLTPPPVVPALSKREAEYREAYRRGQEAGKALGILLVLAAIVGGIVFLAKRNGRSRARRRRRSRMTTPIPPPLSPDLPAGLPRPPAGPGAPSTEPPPLPRQAPSPSSVIRPRQWRPRG